MTNEYEHQGPRFGNSSACKILRFSYDVSYHPEDAIQIMIGKFLSISKSTRDEESELVPALVEE